MQKNRKDEIARETSNKQLISSLKDDDDFLKKLTNAFKVLKNQAVDFYSELGQGGDWTNTIMENTKQDLELFKEYTGNLTKKEFLVEQSNKRIEAINKKYLDKEFKLIKE